MWNGRECGKRLDERKRKGFIEKGRKGGVDRGRRLPASRRQIQAVASGGISVRDRPSKEGMCEAVTGCSPGTQIRPIGGEPSNAGAMRICG